MPVHKVSPYPDRHVGPIRAPLHRTDHWGQQLGERNHICPPHSPLPWCPHPASTPHSSYGCSPFDSSIRTPPLFCCIRKNLTLSALANKSCCPHPSPAVCRHPLPYFPKWNRVWMSWTSSFLGFCIVPPNQTYTQISSTYPVPISGSCPRFSQIFEYKTMYFTPTTHPSPWRASWGPHTSKNIPPTTKSTTVLKMVRLNG